MGQKAVTITLSDLAACYAAPVSLFINLGLPAHASDGFVEALYKGIRRALVQYRCSLGGGNVSRAAQLSIDLFAIGEGKGDMFPSRAFGKPGDGLYCTGPLGLARAGLQCLLKKDPAFPGLINRFKTPIAKFDAADILFEYGVRCVMDVSDGLAGDARHIAEASDLSIEFDLKPGDFNSDLVAFCDKYRLTPDGIVLEGGEDYELLFTCPSTIFHAIKNKLPGAFQVGRCLPFNGDYLVNLPKGVTSYQHGIGSPE
jgi:thiamine-monophosphate kinase